MEIKTKYNIGDKVWVIYKNKGEVSVYDDTIIEICIDKDSINYFLKTAGIDRVEEDIILYDDKAGLLNKILKTMNFIHKEEEEKEC